MKPPYRPTALALAAHQRGVTLSQVARDSGLSRSTLNSVAQGKLAPSPRILAALAAGFGVTEDEARALCPRKKGDNHTANAPAIHYLRMRDVQTKDVCERLPHLSRSGINHQLRQIVSPHEDLVLVVEELTGVPRELTFPKAFATDAATFGGAGDE